MKVSSDGKFTGCDLGDNYPRGILFWTFDDKNKKQKLVYSFKTYHGTTAKSPAGANYPAYKEISGGGK